MHRSSLVLVAIVVTACSARAETLPLITPIPTQYTPGVPLTFTLQAPNLVDVVSFNIDLIVVISSPSTTSDLSLSASAPDPSLYAFGPDGSFSSSVSSGPLPNSLDLNIHGSSALGESANTGSGGSDYLATVTLSPDLGLTGPVTVSVSRRTLSFMTSGDLQFPATAPAPFTLNPGGSGAVPAPAALGPFLLGGMAIVFARRRLSRKIA